MKLSLLNHVDMYNGIKYDNDYLKCLETFINKTIKDILIVYLIKVKNVIHL